MLKLLPLILSFPLLATDLLPTIINGTAVNPDLFPEILRISSAGGECTATAVGPHAILTAAHCVDDGQDIKEMNRYAMMRFGEDYGDPYGDSEDQAERGFEATGICASTQRKLRTRCWQHPKYKQGRIDYDFALCVSPCELPGGYAIIASKPVFAGDNVMLTGFGCTAKNGVGAGVLRIGEAKVTELPYRRMWFETLGTQALCFGDSGGPAYRRSDMLPREVVGVNSRGDIRTRSLFSAVYFPGVRDWMKGFSKRHDVAICGITTKCGAVPPRSHLDAEKMLESADS